MFLTSSTQKLNFKVLHADKITEFKSLKDDIL